MSEALRQSNDPLAVSPHEYFPAPEEVPGVSALPVLAPQQADLAAFSISDVDSLFELARLGKIPRSRALKQGEPEILKPQHLDIVLRRAMGFSPGQIARDMDLTGPWVSTILGHPDAQFLVTRLMSLRAMGGATSVQDKLEAAAHEMLDIALYHARNVKSPVVSQKSAFELMKMAGYGAAQKVDVTQTNRLDNEQVTRLAGALEEAARVRAAGLQPMKEIQPGVFEAVESGEGGGGSS